ncbi:chondrolectin isoform X1 [Mastacembelus armatus]|uniref:Layilin b n=1 Tax=Mastacembelus armatus TaxID=205130 RepID=A0A3Q3S108_9TELE|nr:chondrolectin-like isoform X1 [Mastacembelus armatus]
MDFMKLFGTVIAVLFHPGSASKIHGQRICRQGTQRPCYKVSYIQDSRRRVTFEDASQACRLDGGELLSIETESEQRMIESFIKQLQTGDGDFWIGLRRSPQHHRTGATRPGCPSQYYWLDGSKAKFRNWLWDEPSCDGEMCVVLYHQPSAPPDEGHFLFQWNDANCTSKNNFVCKYPEGKVPVFTQEGKTAHAVPTLRPELSESSVSASDNTLHVSYILYATIPALLLLLFAAAGFLGYKQHVKRRKTETETSPSRSKTWMSTTASTCPIQGPYAFSDVTKLHNPALDSSMSANGMNMYSCVPSQNTQCDYYENVSCSERECGFVTNDIYETCRAQGRHCHSQTGWVENEIYG